MPGDRFLSLPEQVAKVLREGMLQGRWRGTVPGRDRLARELGVSHRTVEAALRLLAKEGLLVSRGSGQRRRIVLPDGAPAASRLRVRILAHTSDDIGMVLGNKLLEQLNKAGFAAAFAVKSLEDLGMDVKRVARFVTQSPPADAWIVTSASREVLQWFCDQPMPAYALFGVKAGLPMAGTGVRKDIQPVIRHLKELGHRRIVLLLREEHVMPKPSFFARSFLEALESDGIPHGSYNLPVWGHQPKGLRRCLDSLFGVTAPTALIVEEAHIFLAARDHLARRGIIAPRDVSWVCLDPDISFSWCDPQIAHFTWDWDMVSRRVLNWAKNISQGKEDFRQTVTMAKFTEGGSMGPARRR